MKDVRNCWQSEASSNVIFPAEQTKIMIEEKDIGSEMKWSKKHRTVEKSTSQAGNLNILAKISLIIAETKTGS